MSKTRGHPEGENGLFYYAPSSYMGLDGRVKENAVDTSEADIQMAPDILFNLIHFTKYEKSTNAKKKNRHNDMTTRESRQSLPEASNVIDINFKPLP